MTVSTVEPFVRYTGDGISDEFGFSFKCTDWSEIRVIVDDGTTANSGVEFVANIAADQDANPGGTITLSSVPEAGWEIYIASAVQPLQTTDLKNATTFRASVIENWMDRMTIVIQQLQAEVDRCLKVGETTSGLRVGELIDPGSVVMTLYMQGLAATMDSAAEMRAEIDALQDAADVIATAHIQDSAITTGKIADDSISIGKLRDGILENSSAGRYKMEAGFLSANGAGRSKMEDGYVTEEKLDPAILAAFPTITMYTTATDGAEDAAFDWPITANDDESLAFAHGLGAAPDLVVLQLVCVGDTLGTSHGYSVGDVLNLSVLGAHADKFGCDYDATRVIMKTGASAISAGKITIKKKGLHNNFESSKDDWRMRAVCYKFGGMV